MFATCDIKQIEREYEYKRNEANRLFLKEKESLFARYPRLKEIELAISKIGIESAKLSLTEDGQAKETVKKNLEAKLKCYQQEKESILKNAHFSLTPKYTCQDCLDTGYITQEGRTFMCHCMKQKLINEAYQSSNLYNLQHETFEKFQWSYYSQKPNPAVYQSELSPYDNMKKIISLAKEFIQNFDQDTQKNLLFTGTTGTGKTYLSSCIANEVLQKGYTVLYQTAPLLLDSIFEYKYSSKVPDGKALYQNISSVNLLIIDDLGTENLTAAKFTELFNLINARLLRPNTKTIISSNLSLEDLNKVYDERIVSRFIGNYSICRFFGDDIRLQK